MTLLYNVNYLFVGLVGKKKIELLGAENEALNLNASCCRYEWYNAWHTIYQVFVFGHVHTEFVWKIRSRNPRHTLRFPQRIWMLISPIQWATLCGFCINPIRSDMSCLFFLQRLYGMDLRSAHKSKERNFCFSLSRRFSSSLGSKPTATSSVPEKAKSLQFPLSKQRKGRKFLCLSRKKFLRVATYEPLSRRPDFFAKEEEKEEAQSIPDWQEEKPAEEETHDDKTMHEADLKGGILHLVLWLHNTKLERFYWAS